MKAKRHYLILTICTLLLCVFASGAERLPVEPEPLELIAEPKPLGLIARANPALAGIDKLYVAITQVDAEPNKDGLVWKELQAKIEHRILKEGIKIVPEFVNGKHIHHLINIPQLTVEITMLKVPNSEQYVFCIRTSLKKQVYLTRDGSRPVKAGILKVGPIIEVASIQDMPSAVTNLALEQTEAFIQAYLAANPKRVQPTNANNVNVVPKKRTKPIGKSVAVEYGYVASKKSTVFHMAACSSVKSIKPSNLVSYNNRSEAIGDGKRPCKRCKP